MNRRAFLSILLTAPIAYAGITPPSFPEPKLPRRVRVLVTAQGQTFIVLDSVIKNIADEIRVRNIVAYWKGTNLGDKVTVEGL